MNNRVLIVDDHPLYRDALGALAHSVLPGDEVTAVTSVEEGLRAFDSGGPQLVLLDFSLRGVSGPSAVTAIRKRFPDAIVLVVSASEDRKQADAALRAGALAFISKASSMEEMRLVLQRALAGEI